MSGAVSINKVSIRLRRFSRWLSSKTPESRNAALVIALVLAVVWWVVAALLRNSNLIPVWYDQETTFTKAGASLVDPYLVKGYVYPPWTAIFLVPLLLFPVALAVLLQLCVYFSLITLIIFKFGGGTKTVLIVLLSFIAFDSAVELNIDWLVCIGLLTPSAFSSIFLMIKPQNAVGYWLSLRRWEFVYVLIVMLIVIAVSLMVWGWWPAKMWAAIQVNSLGKAYNMAPSALIPNPLGKNSLINPISIIISVWLGWRAFKRNDPILGIFAWLFFVPYLTIYTLLLHFALLTVRYPRIGLLLTVVMWIVYGIPIAAGLFLKLTAGG